MDEDVLFLFLVDYRHVQQLEIGLKEAKTRNQLRWSQLSDHIRQQLLVQDPDLGNQMQNS